MSQKVALVTGSATGIGRETAIRLAERGYDVVVNYSRSVAEAEETAALVRKHGVKAYVHCCDISRQADVKEMLAAVEREFGRLDVLVNNAATTFFIDQRELDALHEEHWDRILAVNVKGTYFCIQAAVPLIRKSGGGTIVNVSSIAAMIGEGSSIAYAASKGAVNTMTKSLARVLAPDIRVNAVCPGPVDTRWLHPIMDQEKLARFTSRYPLKRASQPGEVADVVVFMASEASAMMTGQCLAVDGGRVLQ